MRAVVGCRPAVTWTDVLDPYSQLMRAGDRRYEGYRQAALAGLCANVVFGLLRAAVLAELDRLPSRCTGRGCGR